MYKAICVGWPETFKTFGFLKVDGLEGDIFVHYEEIILDWHFRKLYEGEEVLVETIENTSKGPTAKGVRLAGLEEYQKAKAALEEVLEGAEQKPQTRKWADLAELGQSVRQARQEHYAAYMLLAEKRRAEIWLRVPYTNLRDKSWEVASFCEGTREGHITLAHAVKVVRRALEIAESGEGNAQAFKVHRKRLLELRDAGIMADEVDEILEAIRAECERQIAEGRNRDETRRLHSLADDLANDLGVTD